jgi:hypothetical protein
MVWTSLVNRPGFTHPPFASSKWRRAVRHAEGHAHVVESVEEALSLATRWRVCDYDAKPRCPARPWRCPCERGGVIYFGGLLSWGGTKRLLLFADEGRWRHGVRRTTLSRTPRKAARVSPLTITACRRCRGIPRHRRGPRAARPTTARNLYCTRGRYTLSHATSANASDSLPCLGPYLASPDEHRGQE